jgi:asparagine synthase (glutamine-hydrolysing)
MQDAMRHRGPDDRGTYLSPKKLAGLTQTRLSIIDLSPGGHQPMQTPDGRYSIVFNGEIYNFRELKAELLAAGAAFRSNSDTEVILKLYEKYGAGCVSRLQGMFAFAIWDEREESCFCARDPLGIKPFYYHIRDGALVFASEVRALLRSSLVPAEADRLGLYAYLTTGSVPDPLTMIKGVRCLEAGHYLFWQKGALEKKCCWKPEYKAGKISLPEAVSRTREALLRSVERHFVSDVPVGIFLSGGLDSSSILALARASQGGADLRTYSIALEDPVRNEGETAKKVAAHFGAKHTEFTLTAPLAKELLPGFLASVDRPTIDGFNTYCVSYLASRGGVKVVLSGLGGDEIFGGYPSFRKVPDLLRLQRMVSMTGPVGRGAAKLLERYAGRSQWRRLGELLASPPSLPAAYHCFRAMFTGLEAGSILQSNFPELGMPSEDEIRGLTAAGAEGAGGLDAVSWLEISHYMRNQLLRDSDVFSMAWSLELRTPFVDSRLYEELSRIPADIRYRAGKALLTEAVPELPVFLLEIPKKGFLFPFREWLSGEWEKMFRDVSAPAGVLLDTWYRKWSLFILKDYLERNGICA